MDQIGFKTHILGAEKKYYGKGGNDKDEQFVIFGVITHHFIDPRFPDGYMMDLFLPGGDKMREENKGTEGCSDQAEAGK
jgi:hypothetical protein